MLVKLFATFQALGAGSRVTIAVPAGATVADALEALFTEAPALRAHILQPDSRELQQHVNIMVNGRLIRDLQGLATPVRDSDPMAIFPPVAGG